MKSLVLLLINLMMDISLSAVPSSYLGLLTENPKGLLAFWVNVTELWAIPFCLIILGFTKDRTVKMMRMGWGLMNGVLCGALLWGGSGLSSPVNWMGLSFLGIGMVTGLSLFLFNLIEINRQAKQKARILSFSNPQVKSSEGDSSVQNSARLPKVEGV